MPNDYRVRVRVEFYVDLGANSDVDAEDYAEFITKQCFKDDFGRAYRLVIDVLDTELLGESHG